MRESSMNRAGSLRQSSADGSSTAPPPASSRPAPATGRAAAALNDLVDRLRAEAGVTVDVWDFDLPAKPATRDR